MEAKEKQTARVLLTFYYINQLLFLKFARPKTAVFEPLHEKTNKMTVHSAKAQISLGIHPV